MPRSEWKVYLRTGLYDDPLAVQLVERELTTKQEFQALETLIPEMGVNVPAGEVQAIGLEIRYRWLEDE